MKITTHCLRCGWEAPEGTILMLCPTCKKNSLLTLDHSVSDLVINRANTVSFYEFLPWLHATVNIPEPFIGIFRNYALESLLDTSPIWILFSGYYSQKQAHLKSGTFKEFEAISILGWIKEFHKDRGLIMSSAGNAGRALAQISIRNQQPAIIIVPENALGNFWVPDTPGTPLLAHSNTRWRLPRRN